MEDEKRSLPNLGKQDTKGKTTPLATIENTLL